MELLSAYTSFVFLFFLKADERYCNLEEASVLGKMGIYLQFQTLQLGEWIPQGSDGHIVQRYRDRSANQMH